MACLKSAQIGWFLIATSLSAIGRGAALAADVGTLADSSGEVVAWGSNNFGQTTVSNGPFTAVAAGGLHSLGIRSDGSLAGWGRNSRGQTTVPSGIFTAIAAGAEHSLGIRSDGSLAGWGYNGFGQTNVPSGTFTAIAAGGDHNLGIRSDGSLTGWGRNSEGEATVPSGIFTAVAAGLGHSLGIRSDGSLAGWGWNSHGQTTVPSGTFIAVAAGSYHSLAIGSNGALFGWGGNLYGQTSVPSGTFTAVAAGEYHSLGIRGDGSLAGWGTNVEGQTTVPSGIFTAVTAGYNHSLALRARTEYDGDLIVSYPGPPALGGPNGLKASLNRSINVAGNARIASPMYLYNNPVMNVAGKIVFATPGGFANGLGTGTIIAGGGLEFLGEMALGDNSGNKLVVNSAGPLTGSGNLHLGPSARLTAALTQSSLFQGELTIQDSALSFTGSGVINPATLEIYGNSELRLAAGQRVQVDGVGINYGRIELLGNPNLFGGAAEIEIGDAIVTFADGLITGRDAVMRFGDVAGQANGLTNQGSLALTGGTNDLFGDIENADTGSIVVTGGAAATFYDDVVQNGTLRVSKAGSSTSQAVFLGSYSGGGATGGGDIFFEGDLRPGQSPAQVTFNNNVSLGTFAGLNIELGGLAPGTQHDKVVVNGELSLVGTLLVNFIDSFTPQAGTSFDVLDWSSLHGTFSEIKLPELSGALAWDTSQLYTTGVLTVAAAGLPGDYNQNGIVDAADYVVWRKNDGTQVGYNTWRTNFGRTTGSGAAQPPANPLSRAVPEPGAELLWMLALPFLRRRLRMQRMPEHQ